MLKLLFFAFVISFYSSCKIFRSAVELNRTQPSIYRFFINGKDVDFLPMHHMGKQEFYENVKNTVIDKKNSGYVVYYELISTDFTTDSLLKDNIRRKARKLKGFSGSYKDNASGSVFDKYIQQPSYFELGIDSTDKRADVNYLQLIKQWELLNGEIVLDSIDLNTPFDEKFNKGTFYTRKEYNRIFIEYRNEHLLETINASSDKKILILYGFGHLRDFKKKAKKINKARKSIIKHTDD